MLENEQPQEPSFARLITNRQGAADAFDQLSTVAAKLIERFNSLRPPRPEVEHFLKGVVVRTGLHLKDSALLLRTNHDQHLSSVFVLCRVIADDVIRSCFVITSCDQKEALDCSLQRHGMTITRHGLSLRLSMRPFNLEMVSRKSS